MNFTNNVISPALVNETGAGKPCGYCYQGFLYTCAPPAHSLEAMGVKFCPDAASIASLWLLSEKEMSGSVVHAINAEQSCMHHVA